MTTEDDIPNKLATFLDLPKIDLFTFEEINCLVKEWLKQQNKYIPVFAIPPSLCEIRLHKTDILQEFVNYCQTSNIIPRLSDIDPAEGSITDAETAAWRVINLRMYNNDTKIAKAFPKTMAILRSDDYTTIIFSVLEPHKNIPAHSGYYCGVLRYHLGLLIPFGCFIQIDGIKYKWQPDILFDDTFLHSVSNPTDNYRVVLLVDVVRDLENTTMNTLNRRLIKKGGESEIVDRNVTQSNKFHVSQQKSA
jgi:aspartyl/asparaginyl beta-hydroxylase (cupin superfamily)